MLSALQFSIFLLSSFLEDSVVVSFQQKNEIKKGNTLIEFKYLLFRLRIDLFDVKDFQKKFDRWQLDQKMCLTLLTFLLCVRQFLMTQLILQFSVRAYLLIQKYSSIHMHGLAVYVKKGVSFAQDLPLENSADSYLCFGLALLHAVSYFFFLYWSTSLSLCSVFYSIWSNIDEVLSINPSANVFVFGDLDVDHKDCLTYSGGTAWPGELC